MCRCWWPYKRLSKSSLWCRRLARFDSGDGRTAKRQRCAWAAAKTADIVKKCSVA